jgi:putative DNA primase/helicase
MTTSHEVVQQMLRAGLDMPPVPLRLDGRVVRFGPRKVQWYRLREISTEAGTRVVVGSFGDWRAEQHRVDVDWAGITAEESAALVAQRERQQRRDAELRRQAAEQAAMSASDLWARAAREGHSTYLQRKGVDAEGCRFLPDGAIVVPLVRYDLPREQALRGVQVIRADGSKRFSRGLDKPGACLRLGHAVVDQPLVICEGYATALTLRAALDRRLPVVMALDAGNLLPVAQLLRELYPHARLLIAADDDWRTLGNPGREKAHKVCRAVERCAYTWPIFRPRTRGPKDTDFNDLHQREGLAVVQRQLRHVLPLLGSEILNAA